MVRKRKEPILVNNEQLYHCLSCNSFRPESEFSIRSDTGKLRSTCNTCRSKESGIYHRKIRQSLSQSDITNNMEERDRRLNDPDYAIKQYILKLAKSSARHRNIKFDLTVDDICIPDKCPLLDTLFDPNNRKYTYSVDRIDNSKGYIPGNVAIISNQANAMKRDATLNELLLFAKNIEQYIKR